jgi:RNA polymerase sigma factor (sigma-70 family)
MSAQEEISYEGNPNYQAYLGEDTPPWREVLSTTRPDQVPKIVLSRDEQQELITSNLRLVDAGVQKLVQRGVALVIEDAWQDGAVGLCDAAQRYDPARGVAFTTYAPHRVRGEIVDGVRRFNKLGGNNRTAARVVSQLNNTRARSLFAPAFRLGHGGAMTLEDIVPADQPSTETVVENHQEVKVLHQVIDLLAKRQREVILMRLRGVGRKAIAESLGVSTRTVDRDTKKAHAFLRTLLQSRLFDIE